MNIRAIEAQAPRSALTKGISAALQRAHRICKWGESDENARDLYSRQKLLHATLLVCGVYTLPGQASCGTSGRSGAIERTVTPMEISVRLVVDTNQSTKSNTHSASARDLMLSTNRCKVSGKGGRST